MNRWQMEPELDQFLHAFSLKVIPTEVYTKEGKLAVDEIFKLLQTKSRFSLDRCYIGGSVGKKTSIKFSDFDCVIFVNGINYPHELFKVLDDFEDILLLSDKQKLQKFCKTKHSVQFTFRGFEIDLLPGMNFVSPKINTPWESEQAFQVLKRISAKPQKHYDYSSSLCESNLKFIRQQSKFVHNLVRICKFWNRSLYIDEHVSGRSNAIELIAIYAAKKEEIYKDPENPSMLNGFRLFLDLIQNFPSIQVNFPEFNPLGDLIDGRRVQKFGNEPMVSPFIMDPSNPFNNMAKNFKPVVMALFRAFARETLMCIEKIINYHLHLDANNFGPTAELMFSKYPRVLPLPHEIRMQYLTSAGKFMLTTCSGRSEKSPSMKFNRNETKYDSTEMQRVLNGIKGYLETTVAISYSKQQVVKAVQRAVSVSMLQKEKRDWIDSSDEITDRDVNFIVPCPSYPGEGNTWIILGYTGPST